MSLPMYDLLSMQGVSRRGFPEPEAGVNSISPEWKMNPADDSSTNFLFAIRLAGASAAALSEFVRKTHKKADWNLLCYASFVRSRPLEVSSQGVDLDLEEALLEKEAVLVSRADNILNAAVEAFCIANNGCRPTYGDVLSVPIPLSVQDRFPATWKAIIAALGPDCGCRSKRPFVPAFRRDHCHNIEMAGKNKYRYTDKDESPTRPMATNASKSVLFAVFFRLLVKSWALGIRAVVAPQLGLSVFNHDPIVAQEMLALAAQAFSRISTFQSKAVPLVLYVATVDEPEAVAQITQALAKALKKWHDVSDQLLAAGIIRFLPGLRRIPNAHVRLERRPDEDQVFDFDLDESGSFLYNSPQAVDVLDGVNTSWAALCKFLISNEFLHFGIAGGVAESVSKL